MVTYLIIAVLVLWSAIFVFKNIMPKTANKTFASLAQSLHNAGFAALAKKIAPKKMAGGCGAGCGCGHESQAAVKQHSQEIKSVKWK